MTDELRERIKKIQALAERGVGGEQETAQKKLEQLLRENGMTESDLEEETTHYYLFSYSGGPYRKKLLAQIIFKVMGADFATIYHSKHTRNKLGIYCTPAQKLEIDLDYEFYCNLFEKEVEILMEAFIQKQDIFPEDVAVSHVNMKDMTPEQRENYLKQRAYEGTIDKRQRPTGMIEDKSEGEVQSDEIKM